jgi:hypothetical protein
MQELVCRNSSPVTVKVTLEPWAETYAIGPGQQVHVIVDGAASRGVLELEQHAQGCTIYGYEGCRISIVSGGEELRPLAESGGP